MGESPFTMAASKLNDSPAWPHGTATFFPDESMHLIEVQSCKYLNSLKNI